MSVRLGRKAAAPAAAPGRFVSYEERLAASLQSMPCPSIGMPTSDRNPLYDDVQAQQVLFNEMSELIFGGLAKLESAEEICKAVRRFCTTRKGICATADWNDAADALGIPRGPEPSATLGRQSYVTIKVEDGGGVVGGGLLAMRTLDTSERAFSAWCTHLSNAIRPEKFDKSMLLLELVARFDSGYFDRRDVSVAKNRGDGGSDFFGGGFPLYKIASSQSQPRERFMGTFNSKIFELLLRRMDLSFMSQQYQAEYPNHFDDRSIYNYIAKEDRSPVAMQLGIRKAWFEYLASKWRQDRSRTGEFQTETRAYTLLLNSFQTAAYGAQFDDEGDEVDAQYNNVNIDVAKLILSVNPAADSLRIVLDSEVKSELEEREDAIVDALGQQTYSALVEMVADARNEYDSPEAAARMKAVLLRDADLTLSDHEAYVDIYKYMVQRIPDGTPIEVIGNPDWLAAGQQETDGGADHDSIGMQQLMPIELKRTKDTTTRTFVDEDGCCSAPAFRAMKAVYHNLLMAQYFRVEVYEDDSAIDWGQSTRNDIMNEFWQLFTESFKELKDLGDINAVTVLFEVVAKEDDMPETFLDLVAQVIAERDSVTVEEVKENFDDTSGWESIRYGMDMMETSDELDQLYDLTSRSSDDYTNPFNALPVHLLFDLYALWKGWETSMNGPSPFTIS